MNTYTQILRELAIEQNKHINDDVATKQYGYIDPDYDFEEHEIYAN